MYRTLTLCLTLSYELSYVFSFYNNPMVGFMHKPRHTDEAEAKGWGVITCFFLHPWPHPLTS